VGESLAFLGELSSAREHLERGIALFDNAASNTATTLFFQDHWLDCFSRDAHVLWRLGYPDQALARCDEVLKLARGRAQPLGMASTLGWVTKVYQLCRDVRRTRDSGETTMALSHEHGFQMWSAMGRILHAWAMVMQGREDDGIGEMRRGLADWQHINLEIIRPYWLALLAEAHGKVGQAEEGLSLVTEGLALADKTEEHSQKPELFRIKGDLMLQESGLQGLQLEQAEACFQKAIEIARRQHAKSLELRATMSLARLLSNQGRRDEARAMLADIYNWFTEGFGTADLKEAKTLLDELSAG
jgi:predicted ATPase